MPRLEIQSKNFLQVRKSNISTYHIDRCELWGFIREINSGIFTCENISFFPAGTTFT